MILLSRSSSQSSQIIVTVPKIEVRDRPEFDPLEQMYVELSAKIMVDPTQLWIFFSYHYTWAIDVLSRRFRFHDTVEFEANPQIGEEILGVAVVATTTSGTAIHPIDTRSDESHLIVQRYVIQSGFVCIGDTICGNKGLRSHLLLVENELIILLTRPPRTYFLHSLLKSVTNPSFQTC